MTYIDYLIQDRWYCGPEGLFRRHHPQTRKPTASCSEIIQVVRPPHRYEHETSLRLRELWENHVYFPTLWKADHGIYNNPVIIVASKRHLIAVKPFHMSKNYEAASYIAIIEIDDEAVAWAFPTKPTLPANTKLLGVFQRCPT